MKLMSASFLSAKRRRVRLEKEELIMLAYILLGNDFWLSIEHVKRMLNNRQVDLGVRR